MADAKTKPVVAPVVKEPVEPIPSEIKDKLQDMKNKKAAEQFEKNKQAKGGCVKMAKGGSIKNLFGGKESYGEELKEAKSLKSGKISPKQFVKGEKSEGHKDEENPSLIAKEIKKGSMSPKQYASVESKEKKYARGGGIEVRGKTRGRMC